MASASSSCLMRSLISEIFLWSCSVSARMNLQHPKPPLTIPLHTWKDKRPGRDQRRSGATEPDLGKWVRTGPSRIRAGSKQTRMRCTHLVPCPAERLPANPETAQTSTGPQSACERSRPEDGDLHGPTEDKRTHRWGILTCTRGGHTTRMGSSCRI